MNDTFGTQYSTVAFGDLWLVGSDTVTRVDPRKKKVKATIRMPESAMAQSAIELNGELWVANNAGGLSVIDPATNKVVDQPVIEMAPYAMATDGDKLWLSDFENSKVVRYDPSTHKVEVSLDISSPTGLAVIDDAVFVAQHRSEFIGRIDPAVGKVAATYQVGFGPENVISVIGTAWVASGDGKAIARIEASGDLVTIPVGEAVLAVGANADGGGPVWASVGPRSGCDASNSSVLRIDPSTSKITGRVDVPCAAYAVQIGDNLWIVDDNSEALYVATVTG